MFSPTGVPGLLVWLQASGIGAVAGSSVTYWQDSSTNGHNFSYTPGNSSTWHFPTYIGNALNGYPIVRFSGVQNLVDVGANQIKLNGYGLSSFIVYSNSGNNYRPIFANDGSQFPDTINFIIGDSGNKYDFVCTDSFGTVSDVIATSSIAYSKFILRSDRFRSTDNLFVQEYFGVIINSGSISLTSQGQDNYLGYSTTPGYGNYFQGDIAEFILYDNAISETNASSVNNYLRAKYFSSSSATSYTGPVSSISGCFLWYDASTIATTNSGVVTHWSDSSGSGNNLTFGGTSGTSLPHYITNNVVFNNQPIVRFSGTTNWLTTNSNNASLNFSSGDLSIFGVYSTPATNNQQTIYSLDNSTDGKSAFAITLNTQQPDLLNASGWGFHWGKGGLSNNGWFGIDFPNAQQPNLLTIRWDRFRTDGIFESALSGIVVGTGIAATQVSTNNYFNIGRDNTFNNFFTGDIAEIVAYNHKFTNVEASSVLNYLIDKYSYSTPSPTPTPTPTSTDPSIDQPTDISGCYLWLRSTSLSGLTNGSAVTYWYDESGSGNDVSIPSGSYSYWNLPLFNTNQLNNYPAVRFSSYSNTDYLYSKYSKSLVFSSGDFTGFVVFRTIDNNDAQSVYSLAGDYLTYSIDINNSAPNRFDFIYSSGNTNSYDLVGYNDHLGYSLCNDHNVMIRHDRFRQSDGEFLFGRYGADVGSGTATTATANTNSRIYIGYDPTQNKAFLGDIFEIINYSRKLSDLQTRQVNAYLLNKYQPSNVKGINLYTYSLSNSGISTSKSLYVLSNYSGVTSNTTLYVGTSSPLLSGVSLYSYSLGQSSGYFPLYVANAQHQFPPLNLYLYNGISSTGSFGLYTMSSRYNQNLFTAYISGATNTYTNNIPLYLYNYNANTNSSLFLYMSGTTNPSITAGTTLTIAGNTAGSSGIYTGKSLYLEGGRTHSSLPLYLQATPINTNPSGYMSLFIGAPYITGVYSNSISLYLGNNASGLNSFCKRMYIKGDGTLRDGLIASATMNLYLGNNQLTPTISAGSGYFFDKYWSVNYFDTAYFSTYK